LKKIVVGLLVLVLVAALGWQNRVSLVLRLLPSILSVTNPVTENQPIDWSKGPATSVASNDERPPNIILILADDMGFNDISLYNGGAGDGTLQTPAIDAIGQLGAVFANGYAGNAVCSSSRAALMTGRYSTRFGYEFTPVPAAGATILKWSNDRLDSPLPSFIDVDAARKGGNIMTLGMPSSEITVAEVLQKAGYYNAHIGKWHLGQVEGMAPTDQGFDDSLSLAGSLYLPKDHPNVVNAQFDNAIDNMVWASGQYAARYNDGDLFEPKGYLTDYYTDNAVEVIEANANRPFFLYLAHWGIHNPLQAAREDYDALSHIEDHGLRVYSAMIRALDRSVARVVQAVENNGLTDNTVIIFTSDNGGAGYIDLKNINKPYRGWKLTHFEGGIHVPFMAKWPGKIAPGTLMSAPIHHFDLFSTIVLAAGAEEFIPDDRKIDGVDLMPFIRDQIQGVPHKTLFWRQGSLQSVLHEGWKLINTHLADKNKQKQWLFDLSLDPNEKTNLVDTYPIKVAELEALLATHNAQQLAPLSPKWSESPQMIDKNNVSDFVEGDEYLYFPN
jgi:arylsulfatase A-like enzyme